MVKYPQPRRPAPSHPPLIRILGTGGSLWLMNDRAAPGPKDIFTIFPSQKWMEKVGNGGKCSTSKLFPSKFSIPWRRENPNPSTFEGLGTASQFGGFKLKLEQISSIFSRPKTASDQKTLGIKVVENQILYPGKKRNPRSAHFWPS